MKKVITYIISIVLSVAMLVGCGKQREYEFCQPTTNIKCIEIISVPQYSLVSHKTLAELEPVAIVHGNLWTEFLDSFRKVPCFAYFNDPANIIIGDAIRIAYEDGTYELICEYSAVYLSPGGESHYPPYYFDTEAFATFIDNAKKQTGLDNGSPAPVN